MTKTVSLETAKRLKEAGWPQEQKFPSTSYDTPSTGPIAAPDVSELLEALPEGYEYPIRIQNTTVGKRRVTVGIRKLKGSVAFGHWEANYRGDNPAEALARLWLELKAKNLL